MTPYYEDEWVTLYHSRCEDFLPTLEPESVDVLLVDPPYFQVKDEDWDRQWKQRDQFLTWLGDMLDLALPSLTPGASVWLFASPELTSTIDREVVAPRLRSLNSIRWVKEAGWHQKAEVEAQRRYLTAWEGILFAERKADRWASVDYEQQPEPPVHRNEQRQRPRQRHQGSRPACCWRGPCVGSTDRGTGARDPRPRPPSRSVRRCGTRARHLLRLASEGGRAEDVEACRMMPTVAASPGWMKDAACRWSPDPDLYFPEGRGPGVAQRTVKHAVAVCAICPVRTKCLDYALENRLEGIWGGLTDAQRDGVRRAAR